MTKTTYSKETIKALGRLFRFSFSHIIECGDLSSLQVNDCFKTLLSHEDDLLADILGGRIGMGHASLGTFFMIDNEGYVLNQGDEIIDTIHTDKYRFVLISARYDEPEYIDPYTGHMIDLEDSYVTFIGIQFK